MLLVEFVLGLQPIIEAVTAGPRAVALVNNAGASLNFSQFPQRRDLAGAIPPR